MGPTWVLSAPDGTHVGLMNLAIRELIPAQLWKHVRNTYLMRSPWASCQIAATHVPWYIPGSLIHDGGRGRGGGGAFSLFCFVFVFCFEYILHTFYICLDASQCDNILFSFTLFSCLKQCFIVFIVLCALLLHGHILGTFYCISINEVTLKSVGKSAVCKSDQKVFFIFWNRCICAFLVSSQHARHGHCVITIISFYIISFPRMNAWYQTQDTVGSCCNGRCMASYLFNEWNPLIFNKPIVSNNMVDVLYLSHI